jgi:hypothetical protein
VQHDDATPGRPSLPPPPVPAQGQKWPSYWTPPAAVAASQADLPPPGQAGEYLPDPWFPAYQPVVAGPYWPSVARAPSEPMAGGALATGIAALAANLVGWTFGWLFLGPLFWVAGLGAGIAGMVMARVARRRIVRARGALGGDAMVAGGLVTSIIAVVLATGGLVVTVVVAALFGLLYAAGG